MENNNRCSKAFSFAFFWQIAYLIVFLRRKYTLRTMRYNIIRVLLLLLPAAVMAQETTDIALIINEVQTANIDQFLDNANCYGSWIELYNPTDVAISVSGLHLTDGVNDISLANAHGSVPANGFKTFWFDHYYSEGNYGNNARRQIPFKLEPEGGTISLMTSDSTVISSVDYPPSICRCSWARTQDGGDDWDYTSIPTPGATNATSKFATFRLEAPVVDTDSRVFSESFTVKVKIPRATTLRYTTDGSAPTATNGETSSDGVFDISSTTILRLCLIRNGYLPSPVVTRSYIYQNHDYYLPILSICSEPKNFYDDKIGVFIRGTNGISGNGQSGACNWNMDWERPINMEYLIPPSSSDGVLDNGQNSQWSMVLNMEADLEICGGYTRAYGGATVDGRSWESRPSFRIKTDKRYEGVNSIDYPVFPSKPYNKYRCWQVRNGGNDTYARIKDPAVQQIVLKSGFYVDCQDYQPAHVFLNGDYYGMLNIRESNNKHFAYSNYGIDFDDMDQFDLSNARYNQKLGDNKAWMQLQTLAKQLASTKSEEIYREICDLLDMDEFINYMAMECYVGSSDWITNNNNVKGFRSRTDGKFHFVLFDADSAFEFSDMLTRLMETSVSTNVDDLFRNLMKYDPIRRQFMDAYCIANGSVFEPTRCEAIIREIYQNTNPALWFEGSSSNMRMANSIRNAYNGSRISTLRSYYGTDYSLYATISANIPEARLGINGQEIPTGKFAGYLFSYQDLPIEISAKAPAGYTFSGWMTEGQTVTTTTLIPEGSDWMYYDHGSMDRFDWKSLSFNASEKGWRTGQAPFGFANAGYYMQENAATKLDQGTDNKRSTYYFRKTFHLETPLQDEDILAFNYQIDDGVMLYVNGHEVGGYYIASGSTYADYTIGGHYEGQDPYYGSFVIPHEFVVVGDNQIAVEVKNCHGTSSDVWFEGSLTLTGKGGKMIAAEDVLDLHENFDNNSNIVLQAVFTSITDEQQRWEAGASPLRINEVSAGNDIYISDYGKKSDWVELYNTTDQDISLEGIYLSDNRKKPQKYRLTNEGLNIKNEDFIVPAHGTRIIWCDGKNAISQLHAPFKLENADGACVSIQAADGSWADCLEYTEQGRWQTYGRYPDGGNMATILNQPTIENSNKLGMTDFITLSDDDWQGTDRTITLDLAEGWNWISHNMAKSVDKSRFLANALCLQGQVDNLLFSDEDGWQGTLQALEAAKGYKIKMQKAASVTLRGAVFDVSQPVSLQRGWNWIGCPLYNATTLETALANFVPEEGDKVVGLDVFATYEDGQWHGSLTAFQPGQSYLLYTSRQQEFCWQSLSPIKSRSKHYAPARHAQEELSMVNNQWSMVNIHAYPNVMTMVAEVKTDDNQMDNGQWYVGAFCGDECRGIGITIPQEDGRELIFMNIHGDGTVNDIVFRLMDAQGEVYEAAGSVAFHPQTQLGDVHDPHLLWVGNGGIPDEIRPALASASKITSVQYFNLAGQQIQTPSNSPVMGRTKSLPSWGGLEGSVIIRKEIHEDGSFSTKKIMIGGLK